MAMRPILLPGLNQYLSIAVSNNDDILLSFCWNKKPKYGVITNYGIAWENYDKFRKDADDVCHEFYHLLAVYLNNMVVVPCHADEVYNLRINPITGEKLGDEK